MKKESETERERRMGGREKCDEQNELSFGFYCAEQRYGNRSTNKNFYSIFHLSLVAQCDNIELIHLWIIFYI